MPGLDPRGPSLTRAGDGRARAIAVTLCVVRASSGAPLGASLVLLESRARVRARHASALAMHGAVVLAVTHEEAFATVRVLAARGASVAVIVGRDRRGRAPSALLAALRGDGFGGPLLVVASEPDARLANRALRFEATCLYEPVEPSALALFAARAAAEAAPLVRRVPAVLARVAHERRLSPRERELAEAIVLGVSRAALATTLGVTENSIKSFVRALLHKTGAPTTEAFARAVLDEVVQGLADAA